MHRVVALALSFALLAVASMVSGEARPAYVLIVHQSNPASAAERAFLADAFLKKTTSWSSGEVIRPVDLPPGSTVRQQFTDEVLHRTIPEVKGYWQQRIFSGRDVPPPELDREEDVVRFVLRHPGAVGYVS